MTATRTSTAPTPDTGQTGAGRACFAPDVWAVAAATLAGALLRTAFLRDVLDFNADEACVGVYAQHLLHGDLRYLAGVTDYFGPLHTVLVALCLVLGGESIVAVRAASALAGTALVPATYLLCRTACGQRKAAVAAAALAAVFPLHVALSRMAYSVSLLPTVDALALVCLLRFYRGAGRWWGAGAGLLLGAGLQLHPVQYALLGALVVEFAWRRRWRGVPLGDALLVTLLAAAQSPTVLNPLLARAFGTAPELRFAMPGPAPDEGWTLLEAAGTLLAAGTGIQCADLGARVTLSWAWGIPMLWALLWGGVTHARTHGLGPAVWALATSVACGALAVDRGFGEHAWHQRYLALLAPLAPLVAAGILAGAPRRGRDRLAWALVSCVAMCQAACVGRAILAQRRAPRPITALAREMPGIMAERPWGILGESWWVFWPVRFLTGDGVPVFTLDRRQSNHVAPAADASAVLIRIGWLPDGRPSGWVPSRMRQPDRLQVRRVMLRCGESAQGQTGTSEKLDLWERLAGSAEGVER